jgi:hypothetical protein
VSKWLEAAREVIDTGRAEIVVPQVATFDHLPNNFAHLFRLDWSAFEFDHSELEGASHQFGPYRNLPSGVVYTTRAKLASKPFDPIYSFKDIALLDFFMNGSDGDPDRIGRIDDKFTQLKLREHLVNENARLVNLYAFAEGCERRIGTIREETEGFTIPNEGAEHDTTIAPELESIDAQSAERLIGTPRGLANYLKRGLRK